MRLFTKQLFLGLLFCAACTVLNAQQTDVINNDVNFQMGVIADFYGGPDDGLFDNDADPVIKSDLFIGTQDWDPSCYAWECDPNCVVGGNPALWVTTQAFDAQWGCTIEGFESDSSFGVCDYSGANGDDDQCTAGSDQASPELINPDLSAGVGPCQWNTDNLAVSDAGWMFPGCGYYDEIFKMTWRYVDGNTDANPLQFGAIATGVTKNDINSTAIVEGNFDDAMFQYSNEIGNPSADVWYSFSISQPSQVIISTDNNVTDFNSYLQLWEDNIQIEENDDLGIGNLNAEINTFLCAGTYKVLVEGFENNVGKFKLSIAVSSNEALSLTTEELVGASCLNDNDGSFIGIATGGFPPYTYSVDGITVLNPTLDNATVGTYNIGITDNCDFTITTPIEIVNADDTPPVADCFGFLNLDFTGTTINLTPAMIDDGSTDNCEIVSYVISPSVLNVGDAGINEITMTITDSNGNTDECTTIIELSVGVDNIVLASDIKLYPSPNNGTFTLDLAAFRQSPQTAISVMDQSGRIVHQEASNQTLVNLNINDLVAGFYIIELTNSNNRVIKRFEVIK